MLTESAKGVFTIAVTPFLPDGALDTASLATMTEFYLRHGASGLTLLGVMGEAPRLTHDESLEVVRRVVKAAAGAVPVVVGVTAPGLAAMRALAEGAVAAGAAGVMVAPAPGLRTDQQIFDHFGHVARALGDIPFVLQDFPLVTGVQIAPAVLRRIFDETPTCVMLKHEDWPGLDKITALREAEATGKRRVAILCGNGGQFLPEEMARGADGAMTGFAFPEMMAGVTAAMAEGDRALAQDIFDCYLPLVRYEAQPGRGLAVRKHVLAQRGAIAHATQRAPGAALDRRAVDEVTFLIDRQIERLEAQGLLPDQNGDENGR